MKNKLINICIDVLAQYDSDLNFNSDQYKILNDKKLRTVLESGGFNDFVDIVRDIESPSQDLQTFILSKWNGKGFPYIDKPSVKTSLQAIKINPDNYHYVINPHEKISIAYVMDDKSETGDRNFHVLKNLGFLPSPKLQLEMVRNNPFVIEIFFQSVKNYQPREVLLLAALNRSKGKTFPIIKKYLKNIPEIVELAAIRLDPSNRSIE